MTEHLGTMFERVYVEIGNICNLSCSFCTGTTRAKRQMRTEEFAQVCERLQGHAKYLYLHVLGEPLLHPNLGQLLTLAGEAGFSVCITTNGTLLPRCGDVLLQRRGVLHKVSVSLHAPEGNGMPAEKAYLDGVAAFARQASEAGVFTVFRLWNGDSAEGQGKKEQNGAIEAYLKDAFPGEWQRRPRGYRIAKNTFLEYDGVFTWPTDSRAEAREEGFCHALSAQIAILCDGTVVPCCLDANGEIPLGNILEQPLDEILASEPAASIRRGFAQGKFVAPLCKTCTFARKFSKRR